MGASLRRIYIGTAGWSIPRASIPHFPSGGSHLQRYSQVMPAAEINSSFYRPHQAATYAKWAAATPPQFRFAVKVPKLITHELKLRKSAKPFQDFLQQTGGLGSRRGPLLVQLPPSLECNARAVSAFFTMVRSQYDGDLVCEPRHASWFTAKAGALLKRFRVGRVAADPPTVKEPLAPAGWDGIAYYRLHGTPRMYWSRYDAEYIGRLSEQLDALPRSAGVWCFFDNTASGAALENAVELLGATRGVAAGA